MCQRRLENIDDLLIQKKQNWASTISKLNKSETHHELECRFSFQGLERIVQWNQTLSFLLNSEGVAENIPRSSCQQARSQNDWKQQVTVAGDKTTWWKKRAIVVVVLNSSRRARF